MNNRFRFVFKIYFIHDILFRSIILTLLSRLIIDLTAIDTSVSKFSSISYVSYTHIFLNCASSKIFVKTRYGKKYNVILKSRRIQTFWPAPL